MVRKWQLLFAVFIFSLCFLGTSPGNLVFATEQSLRVGVIVPLSGGIATWGMSVKNAIELANDESEHPAELFFEDEEVCIPNKALTAYNRLLSIHKVDVVIASCLGGAQAIGPLVKQTKLPFFISGRSSSEFQHKNPHALSWISLLNYEGNAIAELIKTKGWKSGTAMVWQEYFGMQFAEGIRSAIKNQKQNFSFNTVEVDGGSTPTLTEVQRLIQNKPDVVFLMISEPAAAFVMRQLHTFKYQGTVILQSSLLQTYDKSVRAVFSGVLQQKFPVNEDEFKKLQQKIKARLKDDVSDDFVFSYDGFKVLLQEAQACLLVDKHLSEACLSERIRNEQWREGASGKFRYMKDGSTERPMVFKVITEEGYK